MFVDRMRRPNSDESSRSRLRVDEAPVLVVGLVVVVVWLLVVGVGCAFAGSVWWGLTSGSWPAS